MTLYDKTTQFAALHVKGDPVILFNIWDAGSAKAVEAAGAKALATGSWSVAAAQGYADGEEIPLDLYEMIVLRIVANVALPLTVDFEGGYAAAPDAAAANVLRMLRAGAVGINFEDQIIGGDGLFSVADQVARISAIRAMADAQAVPLVINARTDLFLQQPGSDRHEVLLAEAIARAAAYAAAGASSFFVPGLAAPALIEDVCAAVALPVNVMMQPGMASVRELAKLGVGRISHGPGPYRQAMRTLEDAASQALQA